MSGCIYTTVPLILLTLDKIKENAYQSDSNGCQDAPTLDLTIIFAISAVAAEQANPTEKTTQCVKEILDNISSNPNAKIRFDYFGFCVDCYPT